MSNLTIREFNSKTIRIRADRYVCLTDMAKATGKKVNDWLRLKSTDELIEALESVTGIPATELLQVIQGGIPEMQGTFAHPHLSLDFAQWCNVQLKIQCLKWLDELLTTGKVELEPKPVQLPPADIRINDYVQNIKFLGIDVDNPRYSQYIKDLVLNEIIGVNKALPESTEVWLGVAEKAEKLGYPVSLVVKYRSPLGKFVKACIYEYNLEFTQEERLVNGRGTLIGLYKDCDALTQVVSEFMDAKVLTTK